MRHFLFLVFALLLISGLTFQLFGLACLHSLMTNRTDRVFTLTSPRQGFSSSHSLTLEDSLFCCYFKLFYWYCCCFWKSLYHYIANVYGLTNTNPQSSTYIRKHFSPATLEAKPDVISLEIHLIYFTVETLC